MKYLKDYIDGTFKITSFPNSNVIRYNYNQGILIVEGSYAEIIGNKIDANMPIIATTTKSSINVNLFNSSLPPATFFILNNMENIILLQEL